MNDVWTSLAAAGKPLPTGVTPELVKAADRLATKEFAPNIAPAIRDPHGHAVLQLSMGACTGQLLDDQILLARSLAATAFPAKEAVCRLSHALATPSCL